MLERFPRDIIQEIMLALFRVSEEELKTGEQLRNGIILKTALHALVNFSVTNKFMYSSAQQICFLEALAKQLVNHLGYVFDKGSEKNILLGIEGDSALLKKFIKILTHIDIRNFLSFREKEDQTQYYEILKITQQRETQKAQNNPVLYFLQTMIEVRFGNINGINLEKRLTTCVEQGLLNAKFAKVFFENLITNKVEIVRFPEVKFTRLIPLNSVNSENLTKTHKQLSNFFAQYGFTLCSLDTVKSIANRKRPFSSYSLHELAYSWLIALAIDHHRTKRVINLLNKTLIPLRVRKILALAQSSHPEAFLKKIPQLNPIEIAQYSSTLVRLYSSEFSDQLHEKLFMKDKQTSVIYLSMQRLTQGKKSHKAICKPQDVLTVCKKIPEETRQKLLANLSFKQILESKNIFELLSHPSVNLEHWKSSDLNNLLFKSKTKLSDEQFTSLAKLPFALSLFNKRTDLEQFLNSGEFNILSNYQHGNLLLSKLNKNVTDANQFRVDLNPQDSVTLSTAIEKVSFNGTLLELFIALPINFVTWLIDKHNCDLKQTMFLINANIVFHKIYASGVLPKLLTYIKNIDFLFQLDNFKLKDNNSILDFLLEKFVIDQIFTAFPTPTDLMSAYKNKLLHLTYEYRDLLKLACDALKTFYTTPLSYGNKSRNILDVFLKATPEIYSWLGMETVQHSAQLAQKGIVEILANCRHLPFWEAKDRAKILQTFEILHANLLDEKYSLLEFILIPEMQHSLIPILKLISSDHPQQMEILCDREFMRAIADADPKHPLFTEALIEDWYQLFLKETDFHFIKSNLFAYITSSYNKIYWRFLKENYQSIQNMCSQAMAIIISLEQHNSKASFFTKPKENIQSSASNKLLKREYGETLSGVTKKQRLDSEQSQSSKHNPYKIFITALNGLNSRYEKNVLSRQEEVENLQILDQRINTVIDEIELTTKFQIENDNELTVEDQYNMSP